MPAVASLIASVDPAIALGSSGPAIPWVRIVLAFAFCALVAGGAIFLMHRKNGRTAGWDWRRLIASDATHQPGANPPLRVTQQLQVVPGGRIVMLECEGRRYLLHVNAQGSQLIDRLDAVEDTP